MTESRPVCIADSCIGGLSVLRSLWGAGRASRAAFLADYAINPVGVKDGVEIADVVDRWLHVRANNGGILIMACNTLSVRHHEMGAPRARGVVTMVDCFREMARAEAARLADRRVLVVGTRYTASSSVYPDILAASAPGVRVDTVAATELERVIARLEAWDAADETVLTGELRQALADTDVAVLACTCFPMARSELESAFPNVTFLDPGAWCPGLLPHSDREQEEVLSLTVTGDVVAVEAAREFTRGYLGRGVIECCI